MPRPLPRFQHCPLPPLPRSALPASVPVIHPGTDTTAGAVDCGCPGMMLLMHRRPEGGAPLIKLPAWCWMRLAMSL